MPRRSRRHKWREARLYGRGRRITPYICICREAASKNMLLGQAEVILHKNTEPGRAAAHIVVVPRFAVGPRRDQRRHAVRMAFPRRPDERRVANLRGAKHQQILISTGENHHNPPCVMGSRASECSHRVAFERMETFSGALHLKGLQKNPSAAQRGSPPWRGGSSCHSERSCMRRPSPLPAPTVTMAAFPRSGAQPHCRTIAIPFGFVRGWHSK